MIVKHVFYIVHNVIKKYELNNHFIHIFAGL